MRIREELGRLGLKLFFNPKLNFRVSYENFDRKRKEPFILLANHASLYDPLYIGMNVIRYPYPVASNILYTNPIMNFALTKIIKSIPKRKGQSDIQTIRSIIKAFKEDHRGVMLFPEGNSSYFGEQTNADYESTAKLVKKIGHEVVYAKISGGFLAAPRWGKIRKKGDFHIHFAPLFTVEDMKKMSLNEIELKLKETITYNDYDWNRVNKIVYKSNQKAIGLEHYLYYCPKCGSIQTIQTKHNDIYCKNCGKISTIDKYEFLSDLPFDNLVDWSKLQLSKIPEIVKKTITSEGELFKLIFEKNRREKLGLYQIELKNHQLILTQNQQSTIFDLSSIEGLVLTQKRFISFDYEDQTYMIKAMDPMIILDAINYLKGDN